MPNSATIRTLYTTSEDTWRDTSDIKKTYKCFRYNDGDKGHNLVFSYTAKLGGWGQRVAPA